MLNNNNTNIIELIINETILNMSYKLKPYLHLSMALLDNIQQEENDSLSLDNIKNLEKYIKSISEKLNKFEEILGDKTIQNIDLEQEIRNILEVVYRDTLKQNVQINIDEKSKIKINTSSFRKFLYVLYILVLKNFKDIKFVSSASMLVILGHKLLKNDILKYNIEKIKAFLEMLLCQNNEKVIKSVYINVENEHCYIEIIFNM